MASCNSRTPKYFLGMRRGLTAQSAVLTALLGTAATGGVAAAADMTTPAATPTGSGPIVIDARRALPIFPANGWKDGFFVEHSGIGDFGLHIRGTGIYGRDPLGRTDQLDAVLQNRFTLHAAALVSIAGWAELGVGMPFVLYQDGTGLQLSKAAIGDLALLGKLNLHMPDKAPQIAFSLRLGFQTATDGSALGAGNISGYPRLIIDMPKLSPTMEEGQISVWHKKVGDTIIVDDLLAEVETDKATMEYRSFDKGTLLAILKPAGSMVRLGEPVAIVGNPGEDISAMQAAGGAAPKAAPAKPAAKGKADE